MSCPTIPNGRKERKPHRFLGNLIKSALLPIGSQRWRKGVCHSLPPSQFFFANSTSRFSISLAPQHTSGNILFCIYTFFSWGQISGVPPPVTGFGGVAAGGCHRWPLFLLRALRLLLALLCCGGGVHVAALDPSLWMLSRAGSRPLEVHPLSTDHWKRLATAATVMWSSQDRFVVIT